MENFQYSIQLSDRDWAEFSATSEECGLLQAGLASGDELVPSDTDQGDSRGSGPQGPLTLLQGQQAPGGRGWPSLEEEDKAATRRLVSRSWHEPSLAAGAGQQTPSTSTRSEALSSLSSGAAPSSQSSSLLGPASSRDDMQRLLQGPDPQSPAPSPPGGPPPSLESSGCRDVPQRPLGSPGAPPRSLSRKKRRAAGTKGGGRPSTPGSAPAQLGSPLLSETRPEGGPGLAGSEGKGLSAETEQQTAGAGQDELGPESAGAFEQEAGPDVLMAKSDVALSTPASKPRLDLDLSTLDLMVKPEVDSPTPVSKATPCAAPPHLAPKAQTDVHVPGPAADQAGPRLVAMDVVSTAGPGLSPAVSPGGLRGKPTSGVPGHHLGETPLSPVQAPKKKKVRFSTAVPSPQEPGSGEALGPPSLATARPSAPRTAAGARGGPGGWDAMAVGPRIPQPRILKHLPPPAPSASGGPGPRSCFAVTLPEAYEFFFCDTIEEEDEDVEEVSEAGQAPAEVQWPDMCEFFFQDCRAQRPGHRGGLSAVPPPQAAPVLAPLPGDLMPISIPEAYEHFLGEDRSADMRGLADFLQLRATEAPRPVPRGVGPGTLSEPSPGAAQQLRLVARQAGEPQDPLAAFTFNQNDMCLMFVAFATWAVRTSDLHTPDAWKTVLLANVGTVSAIHYFRRQAGQGR
ncbi:Pgc-1 And Err-Induced Regulator In Muscle Protein 1 [Manis pentadactyla]|nr:Pgc-1 And Err-Induced Regulator In Muscle Protein 1 [Manis pentadactyla]